MIENRIPSSMKSTQRFPESTPEQKDTILLMTEIRSAIDKCDLPCMQLVKLSDGKIAYCNERTETTCSGCDRPICNLHWSEQTLCVYEQEDIILLPLCLQCASLTREDLHTLRALRFIMNER